MAPLSLRIDGQRFRDPQNREVTLRGINFAADSKYPARPDQPSHIDNGFFDGDNVSFVGRPFAVSDAPQHLERLKRWGYNTIRYIFTWEAIEHAGPGQYDEEWIQSTIEVLRLIKSYGFYVFMDPHQDVWSRFSGGSGAPMWTLYAAGFNPTAFKATQAAIVHNTSSSPAEFPKMIWSTNYTRLVCQTIFTMFFAGRDFTPKAIINGQNIQDYLQDHYNNACKHLAQRIKEAGSLHNESIFGWESMNEPARGLVGWEDLSAIPKEQQLHKGTSPTAWQAILTGSGRACEIDTWDFGSFGAYKTGKELVDPEGQIAWLADSSFDSKYGWKRSPDWKLGECIWAQHGIWDPTQDKLLQKDYFSKVPSTGEKLNYEKFTNKYFLHHYRSYRDAIRSVFPDTIMLCQAPVLEIPPSIKGTEDDDPNMVHATHYYDGLTLITKHWNKYYNVDVFGVLRGRYLAPAFALKVGETAIRNCLRDQLDAIRKEGLEYMGEHPCIYTEIGIPYDMDDKHAYKTGDYTSQSAAMDANHFALEGCGASGFTLWVYVGENSHTWGDQWNGEDLSIYCREDREIPASHQNSALGADRLNQSTVTLDPASPTYSESRSQDSRISSPETVKDQLKTPSIVSQLSARREDEPLKQGLRAAEAYVRPSPISTAGDVKQYGFDLKNCVFTFSLAAEKATEETHPTTIFLPEFHFPRGRTEVEVSGGKWSIEIEDFDGSTIQKLRWWHALGDQNIKVTGVTQRQNELMGSEEDEGYLEQCQRSACLVM